MMAIGHPEFVAIPIARIPFRDIFELCYLTLPKNEKEPDKAAAEYNKINATCQLLGVGVERFESGTRKLVAVAAAALITREFADELRANDRKADVQRLIFKRSQRWAATDEEVARANVSPLQGAGNTLLALYYKILDTPNAEEYQSARQLLHDKFLAFCGGYRLAEVMGELWDEGRYKIMLEAGFRDVNSYGRFKSRHSRFVRARQLQNAPCIYSIKDINETKDVFVRSLLRYRHPILGLTPAQKAAIRADLGILPYDDSMKQGPINTHRQRIYKKLESPEFQSTWLGSELRKNGSFLEGWERKLIVDNYLKDNLQELRPYPSMGFP